MKSISSLHCSEIHPSYFELAYGPREQVSASKKEHLFFTPTIRITELCGLLAALALLLYALYLKHQDQVPSPSPSITSAQAAQIEKRFQLIGQVLDYLVNKPSDATPAAAFSSEPKQAKTCRIAVPKALLRSGPGKKFSPLMALGMDSELVVQDESGDWLRIIAPTGESAWVAREVVTL